MTMEMRLDEIAFRFFKRFAECESILKERGFFLADQRGNVSANWDRFVNEVIGRDFVNFDSEVKSAIDFILQNPPMKQVVENGKIVWAEAENVEPTSLALFIHLRRIRNNLFHGAKFNGSWFDPERNHDLLTRGVAILDFCRENLDSSFQ